MTQGQRALVGAIVGEGGVSQLGAHYIQHLSQTQYSNVTRYDNVNSSFYGFYNGGLADLQEVININTDEATRDLAAASGANNNQIAAAMIMQAWTFISITDIWGDLPFSQALKGAEFLMPIYDTQRDIYEGVVANLTAAGDMITGGSIEGDIIFGGDMDLWRKFANSLILRAGVRVSEADADLGRTWVRSAVQRGVMTSTADIAQFTYLGSGDAANNEYYNDFLTRTDYAISDVLVDILNDRNDPRVEVYAQPTEASVLAGTPDYVGMPYGLTQAESGAIPIADVSFPGLAFISATSPAVLMNYAEVLFNQAEAAARGWLDDDAGALYNAAITASMNQHGITDATAISDYLAQGNVAYDAGNWREMIGTQKWIAQYFQGVEAWADWRRIDFPSLDPAPQPLETDQIPRRRGYPTDEANLNAENYQAAIDRQFGGADDLDGTVWWDQ